LDREHIQVEMMRCKCQVQSLTTDYQDLVECDDDKKCINSKGEAMPVTIVKDNDICNAGSVLLCFEVMLVPVVMQVKRISNS
jgi:hypothetical protein